MKKNFVIPDIKVENFQLENILLASGAATTNVEAAQTDLESKYRIGKDRTVVITF